MYLSEIKTILKSRTSKVIMIILLIPSLISCVSLIKRGQSQDMDYEQIMTYVENLEADAYSLLDNAQAEAIIAKNLGTERELLGKENVLVLAKERVDSFQEMKKQVEQLKANQLQEMKQRITEFEIKNCIYMTRAMGIDETYIDPIIYFKDKIDKYDFLKDMNQSKFDYDYHTSFHGALSIMGPDALSKNYENGMKQTEIYFYKYEHNQFNLSNNNDITANVYLSQNKDSLFSMLFLFLGAVFVYLNTMDFKKSRMDLLYCSFPKSRTKIYISKLLILFITYLVLVEIVYLLPIITSGIINGFDNFLYPGLIDGSMMTSYQAHSNILYDGIVQYTPCLSQIMPGMENGYPFLNQNLVIIPLWLQFIITNILMILEIFSISTFVSLLAMCTKSTKLSTILVAITLFGISFTRIQYVPMLSLIPIFYPNPIYLLAGGHNLGWIPIISFILLWCILFSIIGIKKYKKTKI